MCGKTKADKDSKYVEGGSTTLVCPKPIKGRTIRAEKSTGMIQIPPMGVSFYEMKEDVKRYILKAEGGGRFSYVFDSYRFIATTSNGVKNMAVPGWEFTKNPVATDANSFSMES